MEAVDKYQNILTREEVATIIKQLDDKLQVNNYVIKPASEHPMGFLGEHLLLFVELDNDEKLRFFVKKMPTEVEAHLKYAQETRAFYKEVELYQTLFKDLEKAQDKLAEEERWCPVFYYAQGYEVIVLEDLTPLGYKMYPEREVLDDDHVMVSLKSMARMHAASIIFEEKFDKDEVDTRSKYFTRDGEKKATIGEIYPNLIFETESSDTPGHIGNTFCETGIRSEMILIDHLDGYTEKEKKVIREKLPREMRKMMTLVKPSNKFKNVILHGDLWANNLMFRYDENNQVQHAMIIDFQLARYGPPAHDILMFLYLTLNREQREKNKEKYFKFYYQIFTQELDKYHISSEKLLPWSEFKESCDFYSFFAVITNLFYFQLILLPPEISSKFMSTVELFQQNMLLDRSEMVEELFLTDENTRTRTLESLNEVIRNYIL